jgi:hypothetical protein
VRPIYRTFLARPLWWFLARIKAFFLAELAPQLTNIESRLNALESLEREVQAIERVATQACTFQANASVTLEKIERRLQALEEGSARSAAEWDGLEQLLLALFRLPASHVSTPDWNTSSPEAAVVNATDLNHSHVANSVS